MDYIKIHDTSFEKFDKYDKFMYPKHTVKVFTLSRDITFEVLAINTTSNLVYVRQSVAVDLTNAFPLDKLYIEQAVILKHDLDKSGIAYTEQLDIFDKYNTKSNEYSVVTLNNIDNIESKLDNTSKK